MNTGEIEAVVEEVLRSTPFIDIHTHLFPAAFGNLALWGIDELLTYHYLEAELFRTSPIRPAAYWELSKTDRADLIWKTLFVENTPVSEATRGVIVVLQALGLDPNANSLAGYREYFRGRDLATHTREVFAIAGVSDVVMTNDPMDPDEAQFWKEEAWPERGFHAALRLDRILNSDAAPADARRRLEADAIRMKALYMAVSLPDSFRFPDDDHRTRLFREAVLPACRGLNLPLALMIGVRRAVNPELRAAGDASGSADLRSIEVLCSEFPENRFLVTVLSRENQHELCVYARKFSNLLPFGCWWFLNNPSIVEEITRERIEMLGMSFIPQHSDARVLEQLIYKWRSTRETIGPVLAGAYKRLVRTGRIVTREQIQGDIMRLFRGNFESWTQARR